MRPAPYIRRHTLRGWTVLTFERDPVPRGISIFYSSTWQRLSRTEKKCLSQRTVTLPNTAHTLFSCMTKCKTCSRCVQANACAPLGLRSYYNTTVPLWFSFSLFRDLRTNMAEKITAQFYLYALENLTPKTDDSNSQPDLWPVHK